jgi:acetyltransferase AlgX (SGNH hydrolase-like protein)
MKNAFLAVLVSLVCLELFSFAATEANLLLFNDFPFVYRQRYTGDHWRTQKEPWGTWHKINARDRHQSRCFDVHYQSNNVGARDNYFEHAKKDGKDRYVLIGDSFAEGYGVEFNDTAQAQLEKILGVDIYNFGSAGYFGPVQYYLIYKDLASQFQHDGVVLFFLPANDFTDNDYSLWNDFHPSWYRPYYKKIGDDQYDIFYPDNAVPSEHYEDEVELGFFKRYLIQYTFTANTLRTIKYLIAKNPLEKLGYSGYFDASEQQQKAAIYFIEKIVKEAATRRVVIFVIPNREDMTRIKAGNSYKSQYWFTKLHSLAANSSVELVDMADHMPDDYAKLFLTCDSHWNALGNKKAAEIISASLRNLTGRANTLDVVKHN